MNIQLAKSINSYFENTNRTDSIWVKDCFAPDAVVLDERNTYRSHAAITSWLQETQKKYQFSATPISSTTTDKHEIVVAEVNGNFPGSPIQLSYALVLKGEKIQSLEIF